MDIHKVSTVHPSNNPDKPNLGPLFLSEEAMKVWDPRLKQVTNLFFPSNLGSIGAVICSHHCTASQVATPWRASNQGGHPCNSLARMSYRTQYSGRHFSQNTSSRRTCGNVKKPTGMYKTIRAWKMQLTTCPFKSNEFLHNGTASMTDSGIQLKWQSESKNYKSRWEKQSLQTEDSIHMHS